MQIEIHYARPIAAGSRKASFFGAIHPLALKNAAIFSSSMLRLFTCAASFRRMMPLTGMHSFCSAKLYHPRIIEYNSPRLHDTLQRHLFYAVCVRVRVCVRMSLWAKFDYRSASHCKALHTRPTQLWCVSSEFFDGLLMQQAIMVIINALH